MSYFKSPPKVTSEQIREICSIEEVGLLDGKRIAFQRRAELAQTMALEAVEDCRFDANAPYSKVNHTILDLLEYLIRK